MANRLIDQLPSWEENTSPTVSWADIVKGFGKTVDPLSIVPNASMIPELAKSMLGQVGIASTPTSEPAIASVQPKPEPSFANMNTTAKPAVVKKAQMGEAKKLVKQANTEIKADPNQKMGWAERLQYIGAGLQQMGGDPAAARYLQDQANKKSAAAKKAILDAQKMKLDETQMAELIRHNKAMEGAAFMNAGNRAAKAGAKAQYPSISEAQKMQELINKEEEKGWRGTNPKVARENVSKAMRENYNVLMGLRGQAPQPAIQPGMVKVMWQGRPKLVPENLLAKALSEGAERI